MYYYSSIFTRIVETDKRNRENTVVTSTTSNVEHINSHQALRNFIAISSIQKQVGLSKRINDFSLHSLSI